MSGSMLLHSDQVSAGGEPGKEVLEESRASDPCTWVDQYGDYLFRYAVMRVRNPDLAENLVQETFLAALTSRSSFSGHSSEKTWMTAILKHKIIDHFRRDSREKTVSELKTDDEQTVDDFYDALGRGRSYSRDWLSDPEKIMYSKEFWKTIRECLRQMPERTAAVFAMREMENRSTEEICEALQITPTNLWVTLHRARLQMRSLLEESGLDRNY